ncbi:hypothetical protein [Zavarzinella formosa]|uniref:hypothetical protein n=1 Tax=Zavarzinella formosa TaxID=360055 RepID=UPI000697C0D4|nr:hypothetical protein [Zavarzinella formosa]
MRRPVLTGRGWGSGQQAETQGPRASGDKHRFLVDANGILLAVEVTGANTPDAAGTLPLVDSTSLLDPQGETVGLGGRPEELHVDRVYDAEALRDIELKLAKRRTAYWAKSGGWQSG